MVEPVFKGLSTRRILGWVNSGVTPEEQNQRWFCLQARTAAGEGTVEEQLLRLMIWAGAVLRHEAEHSGIISPIDILIDGTGWCDQQVKVWGFFGMYLVGVPTRELALWHCDGTIGHTVGEAFWEDAWHLFDVDHDHSAVYRDQTQRILSFEDLCTDPEPVRAENHWFVGKNGVGKEGLYLPGSRVEVYEYTHYTEAWMKFPWGAEDQP